MLAAIPQPTAATVEGNKGAIAMGRMVMIVGVIMALWMSAGRWLFGTGGGLTWWYVPSIGLVYAAVSFWLAHRMKITRARGHRIGRATIVTLLGSWVCAIGFGFLVPDYVNGQLHSIISHAAGSAFSVEMTIALCNPAGIIAFTLLGASIVFAYADARDKIAPEDEVYEGEGQMSPHPYTLEGHQ